MQGRLTKVVQTDDGVIGWCGLVTGCEPAIGEAGRGRSLIRLVRFTKEKQGFGSVQCFIKCHKFEGGWLWSGEGSRYACVSCSVAGSVFACSDMVWLASSPAHGSPTLAALPPSARVVHVQRRNPRPGYVAVDRQAWWLRLAPVGASVGISRLRLLTGARHQAGSGRRMQVLVALEVTF